MARADSHLHETKISGSEILQGSFLQAMRDSVLLPDGSHATREYVVHPGAVMVIPLIDAPSGQLQVVLKRIEGLSWSRLMTTPDEVRARFELDPLDWHVSVAINVCRAVQFAHERGVVHRDIKPSNVMVGRFGEVYLLDWGVAGTLEPDVAGLLPCVADGLLAGTPSYMAPEQLEEPNRTRETAPRTRKPVSEVVFEGMPVF